MRERWKILRDVILVTLGCFLLIHETLSEEPREIIIAAAFGLLGVPLLARLENRENRDK